MKSGFLHHWGLSSTKIIMVIILPVLLMGCGNPWLWIGVSDPNFGLAGEALPTNFHVLDTGKAYRCAQPHGEELKNTINRFGLKTVLNLNGQESSTDWYHPEIATCQEMNVAFYSYPMDTACLPSPETLRNIVTVLKTAEYPILIHCTAGVDRTGAISTIYRMLIAGDSKSAALKQMGVSRAQPMRDLAGMYEPTEEWLEAYTRDYDQLSSNTISNPE